MRGPTLKIEKRTNSRSFIFSCAAWIFSQASMSMAGSLRDVRSHTPGGRSPSFLSWLGS